MTDRAHGADRRDPNGPEDREAASGGSLNHFACFRLGEAFWCLGGSERQAMVDGLVQDTRSAADRVELYQLYPTRSDADLLLWSAVSRERARGSTEASEGIGLFFDRLARAVARCRPALTPSHTFWGLTRPSPYTRRGGSSREIDAAAGERDPYLIVYPFAKIAQWYQRPASERGEMMREHIRIGRSFEGVRQLLLYSFGLQDQEFVVVYETHDLARFSELVYELRSTEARAFTALDAPVLTARHLSDPSRAPWL